MSCSGRGTVTLLASPLNSVLCGPDGQARLRHRVGQGSCRAMSNCVSAGSKHFKRARHAPCTQRVQGGLGSARQACILG